MKQTAVEWLQEQYNNCPKYEAVLTESDFEQAKELEKQQIINAYSEGDVNGIMDNRKMAEQYYNETFKKNKI